MFSPHWVIVGWSGVAIFLGMPGEFLWLYPYCKLVGRVWGLERFVGKVSSGIRWKGKFWEGSKKANSRWFNHTVEYGAFRTQSMGESDSEQVLGTSFFGLFGISTKTPSAKLHSAWYVFLLNPHWLLSLSINPTLFLWLLGADEHSQVRSRRTRWRCSFYKLWNPAESWTHNFPVFNRRLWSEGKCLEPISEEEALLAQQEARITDTACQGPVERKTGLQMCMRLPCIRMHHAHRIISLLSPQSFQFMLVISHRCH